MARTVQTINGVKCVTNDNDNTPIDTLTANGGDVMASAAKELSEERATDRTNAYLVKGPASVVDNRIVVYDGTSGKLVKDGGVAVLGGSLDVSGQKIVSISNGNIDIEPHGTGNVLLGNFTFDADQTVGAGQDNYVLTYDNGTGLISLEENTGGGGGLTHWTEATGNYSSVQWVQLLATNGASNVVAVLSPKGNLGLQSQVADGTSTGGDNRGPYAIDWQLSRASSTKVASGTSAVICGGYNGVANGMYTFVGGGHTNGSQANYAVCVGGYQNDVAGEYGTIAGGKDNNEDSDYGFIGGGLANAITGACAVIAGGQNNTASNTHSFIGSGSSNTVNNTFAVIVGGTGSAASGDYAAILNGYTCTASANYAVVLGGAYTKASRYAQVAYASGRFAADGDAQTSFQVIRVATTDDTATNLWVDGGGGSVRILIPTDTAFMFDVQVTVAQQGMANVKMFHRTGLIVNDGGTTTISTVNTVGTDQVIGTLAATIAITADDTNDALDIQGTGIAATNLRWVGRVQMTEVSYPA